MGGTRDIALKAPGWLCLASALLLAACASGRELPDHDEDGTLKPSPCACVEIEGYDGGGFEWRTG